jgi:inhibitor of KinA
MSRYPRVLNAGESAFVVEFGDSIDLAINERVYRFVAALEAAAVDGIGEIVPTYRSALVNFNPLALERSAVESAIDDAMASADRDQAGPHRGVTYLLPVLYGGDAGPDLGRVADHNGLSESEVIEIHSAGIYRVFMLGFLPGFPYLGGLDPRIATPRLSTPRVSVPAGAVGIAHLQTGVYPMKSPGGWNLIGLTPIAFFDPGSSPPTPIQPGSNIRFIPVEGDRYEEIKRAVNAGGYDLETSEESA